MPQTIQITNFDMKEFAALLAPEIAPVLQQPLLSIRNALPSPAEEEKLLSRKEAAEMLHVSIQTLWNYTRDLKIPYKKYGRRVLFLKSDLIAFTGNNKTNRLGA